MPNDVTLLRTQKNDVLAALHDAELRSSAPPGFTLERSMYAPNGCLDSHPFSTIFSANLCSFDPGCSFHAFPPPEFVIWMMAT